MHTLGDESLGLTCYRYWKQADEPDSVFLSPSLFQQNTSNKSYHYSNQTKNLTQEFYKYMYGIHTLFYMCIYIYTYMQSLRFVCIDCKKWDYHVRFVQKS